MFRAGLSGGSHLRVGADTGPAGRGIPAARARPLRRSGNDGVNLLPLGSAYAPGSSVLETRRPAMMSPMKRTTFGLRKEITVFQYERGLLYRDGVMERVLEPGRYRFASSERVEVAKVSLREMSHIVPGQGRPATELAKHANFVRHVDSAHLAKAQFPNPLRARDGRLIHCPPSWLLGAS